MDDAVQHLREFVKEWPNGGVQDSSRKDTPFIKMVDVLAEYDALAARVEDMKTALECANAAIGDAIYLEDGLDGDTGTQVKRIIVEAIEQGTFDAPGEMSDFMTKRERQTQEGIQRLEQRLAALSVVKEWLDLHPVLPIDNLLQRLAAAEEAGHQHAADAVKLEAMLAASEREAARLKEWLNKLLNAINPHLYDSYYGQCIFCEQDSMARPKHKDECAYNTAQAALTGAGEEET